MVQTAMRAVADPRKGPEEMISNSQRSRFLPVVGAIALAAALAACSAGVGASAPSPSAPPAPTGEPAPNLRVNLTSTSGQVVTIDIIDGSRSVTGARSGTPPEGVSVDPESVNVENIDARTLRLTWSDFPIDNELKLLVDPIGVGYRLVVVQPAPTGPADAMGEDRILELAFDRDISAAEVEASIQEGLDVPG